MELFASRVFEELREKSQTRNGTRPKSTLDKIDGSFPKGKKKRSVRRQKFFKLVVGDGVSMDEVPSFAERALVGHV